MYPTECGEQLGTDPSKIGSSKSLVLKSFSGEGTLWDSSLPVSLTLWDTPALFTPPLPEPHFIANRVSGHCRFESIRANRSNVMKIGGFLRIDSRESPGHLSLLVPPSTVRFDLSPSADTIKVRSS